MNGLAARALHGLRDLDTRMTRRPDRRRILVDARTPVNFTMVAPVVRAMQRDPRIEFWFTASEEPERMAQIYHEAPHVRTIHPRRGAWMKFDAYVASDFMWAPLLRGTQRVQVFHGVGGKYGFDAPTVSMREWHRLFFVNERRLRNFIAAGAIDPDSPAIRLIGMPKVDCLVDGSLRPRVPLLVLDLHRVDKARGQGRRRGAELRTRQCIEDEAQRMVLGRELECRAQALESVGAHASRPSQRRARGGTIHV